jgi:hypothetical protein
LIGESHLDSLGPGRRAHGQVERAHRGLRFGEVLSAMPASAARDAQLILGHSRLAITLEIYSHEDKEARREALHKISKVLAGDE